MRHIPNVNRYKASLILFVVTCGYLISCPFHATFIGGLISSGFCASMIGGFADWYGITALFRRPLGISYRTEIIPKNRQKIFDTLSNMVSEELLSKENLKKILDEHDVSQSIIKLLSSNKKNVERVIDLVADEIFEKINKDEFNKRAESSIINGLSKINLSNELYLIAQALIKNGFDDKAIDFAVDNLNLFLKTDEFKHILIKLVDKAKNSYEKGKKRRTIVNTVVLDFMLDLSSDKIAEQISIVISKYLSSIQNRESNNRAELKQWIYAQIERTNCDESTKIKIENFKCKIINNTKVKGYISFIFNNMKDNEFERDKIAKRFYGLFYMILESPDIQKNMDNVLKKIMDKLVDSTHENIGKLVRESLDKYSDDMLVDLIESRVGNDLQLIRINGSIVGGLVGILLYILKYVF